MSKPARRVAVIMAGGSGERFWPLSRQKRPKQLLRLTSDTETMIEEAVSRIAPLVSAENVFVATSRILAEPIRAAGLPIPDANILAEPTKRNTAGCLCWVTAQLQARFPGEEVSIAVLTADHQIGERPEFRACVDRALSAAEQFPALVTIGVKPDRPETGYGYIEAKGELVAPGTHRVARFREKPDRAAAEAYVAAGNYSWNSGMFFWRASVFMNQMRVASPGHATATDRMREALAAGNEAEAVAAFESLPDISIDYALMERATEVLVVEASFPWDDVGAWDAMARSRTADANGNVLDGNPIVADTHGSIILNDAPDGMAVGVVGMDNVIVIATKDAVLVIPKDRAQDVKAIVKELKAKAAKQL